jgi:hypothetical protein
MWVVEANGEESTYTYLVDAPEEADPMSVACCAYAQHGQLHKSGRVPELLGPLHVARWQEAIKWEQF